jgi:hypothetical protein
VIVVELTDPQLIAPHGADPRVIILNGMNKSGRFFLSWSSSDHPQRDGSSWTALSCAGHLVIVVDGFSSLYGQVQASGEARLRRFAQLARSLHPHSALSSNVTPCFFTMNF